MGSEVTVEQIARTQDTGDPVFRAETETAWCTFLFPWGQEHDVWIHHVESSEKGGMKALIDFICREYDCRRVRFVNVINDTLADSLEGFEWVEDEVAGEHPAVGETIRCLDGEWEPRQLRTDGGRRFGGDDDAAE